MNMHYLLALVVVAVCAEQAAGKHAGNGRKDPCDDFYCANGGVCILEDHEHSNSSEDRQTSENIESSEDRNSGEDGQSGKDSHSGEHRHSVPTCQCTGDWKGDKCDENPCQNVSCNTGMCLFDDNGSPHCCCPAGTSGEFCEIIVDPCDNVDCNDGTCSPDDNGQASCLCPEFSSGEFCENFVTCPQLESPENGLVTVEDTTVGSTAIYTCNSSTMIVTPHDTLTCGIDGEWDKEPPICVDQFGPDTNLTVSYGNSTYYFSSEKLNFFYSEEFCENLGGKLVAINSEEEWEFIKSVHSQRNVDAVYNAWIGMHLTHPDNGYGVWIWDTDEPVITFYWSRKSFRYWDQEGNPGYYVENSICVYSDGEGWIANNIVQCKIQYKFHFICEKYRQWI